MAEALHPPLYCHICNNINMAAVNKSGPACIIHTIQKKGVWTQQYGSCIHCNLEAQSHRKREKYRLFPPPSSHCFPISVINESLFRWEMRFPFPLFLSIHPSLLCNSLSLPLPALHPHLEGPFTQKWEFLWFATTWSNPQNSAGVSQRGKTTQTACVTSSLLITLT